PRRAWLLPQPRRSPRVGRASCDHAAGSPAHRGRDGGRDTVDGAGRRAPRGRHIAGDRLGWGVLGAAWIAGRAVLPAIAASRTGRLVATASRAHQLSGDTATGPS